MPPSRKSLPLVLKLDGVDQKTPLQVTKRRIAVVSKLLHNAVKEPTKLYGIKLRKSASVHLVIDAAEEKTFRVTTERTRTTGEVGEEISHNFSQEEAWKHTVERTKKVLNALLSYADFADKIRKINTRWNSGDEKALAQLPTTHPNVYYTRAIRPVFGSWYRERFEGLMRIKEVRERRAAVEDVAATPPVSIFEEIDRALAKEKSKAE